MAVYKVAQDVEADDKLIGPFSFRQFVYLIIVAMAIGLAWALSRLFIGLAIIPLPIVLFFGALALPLRKDQPMEIYMAAIVSFYLKPHRRLWQPDGIESLVEITAPKVVEVQRAKNLSQTEAERRLSYLADIADSQGWAIRHVAQPTAGSAMFTDAYFSAQQTEDVLDENGGIARNLNVMIDQADAKRHQDMLARMQQPSTVPVQPVVIPPVTDPYAALASQPTTSSSPSVQFDPYPTEIHQAVINPLESVGQLASVPIIQPVPAPNPVALRPLPSRQIEPANAPAATSETTIPPDIINLANNTDLSIETIQREANRIQHQRDEDEGEEVVISLR